MVFGIDINFLITDAVNRNGHAGETMTSFRMSATIHSHVDSDCRRDEGVSDESHLSRVPRPPVVTDVIQEDALTVSQIRQSTCRQKGACMSTRVSLFTSTIPNNVPISPKPSDSRLTVNGTLSAISGKGSVRDTEPITPQHLYSAVLKTPSPANTVKSPKPQRLLGCRPGPRCSKIYTPGYRFAGSTTRVPVLRPHLGHHRCQTSSCYINTHSPVYLNHRYYDSIEHLLVGSAFVGDVLGD